MDIDKIYHVSDVSEARLKDNEIWDYSLKNDCIIVTHDSDFVDLVTLRGFPPKIIWLRTGNIGNLVTWIDCHPLRYRFSFNGSLRDDDIS